MIKHSVFCILIGLTSGLAIFLLVPVEGLVKHNESIPLIAVIFGLGYGSTVFINKYLNATKVDSESTCSFKAYISTALIYFAAETVQDRHSVIGCFFIYSFISCSVTWMVYLLFVKLRKIK